MNLPAKRGPKPIEQMLSVENPDYYEWGAHFWCEKCDMCVSSANVAFSDPGTGNAWDVVVRCHGEEERFSISKRKLLQGGVIEPRFIPRVT